MKTYAIYLIASLLNFYLIMIYWGVSAGFANYLPIISLFGSVIVFGFASPIIIFYRKSGLILGLLGCLMILVYEIPFLGLNIYKVFGENKFQWEAILFSLPSIISFICVYCTIKELLHSNYKEISNKYLKIILAGIPIILFLYYCYFYGQYWSLEMFKL